MKIQISFPVQEKYKTRNETLEGVEEIRGEDDRGVHVEQPAKDEDPDSTLLQDIDQGQLDEVEVIAGIVHNEKGEDVKVDRPGSTEEKDAVDDVADLPHVSTGKAKDGIVYRNDLGKTVKLDARGRPYPVGADGFRTMKTTRPAGFTPEEWATLRNAIDVDDEGMIHPKKKDGAGSSKDAAPAESTKVNAPSAKRIKAMLKERWGGDQWMYNWGIRKNANKVKNPVEGKFLEDLDWMRIIVNPVDGSVLCVDSKRLQVLGASYVTLDEVYGILVVIYAWKFTRREGLASIPKDNH